MVTEKPTLPAGLNLRKSRSSGWSHILLLAASECGAKQTALEAAVACFARRRLPNVPVACVSQPQPLAK